MTFDNSNLTKEKMISYLGGKSIPYALILYPKDFKSKDNLLNYLDKYNKGKKDKDKIIYTDQAKMISNMSGSIMNAVTIVLIAFSSISLIVFSWLTGHGLVCWHWYCRLYHWCVQCGPCMKRMYSEGFRRRQQCLPP